MKYLSTGNAVYKLCYHLVIVTKYRKKILTEDMMCDIRELISHIIDKQDCDLIEINGEPDHVHLLLSLKPTTSLTKLINSIKTVTSRVLRKKYSLTASSGKKNALWSPSYFITTCGEVKLEVLKRYVENQGNISTPPKNTNSTEI